MSRQQEITHSEIYTQRSMENLSSTDQLKDYLKVTGMPIWIVMISILILLAGIIAWSASATFTSYITAEGTA